MAAENALAGLPFGAQTRIDADFTRTGSAVDFQRARARADIHRAHSIARQREVHLLLIGTVVRENDDGQQRNKQ